MKNLYYTIFNNSVFAILYSILFMLHLLVNSAVDVYCLSLKMSSFLMAASLDSVQQWSLWRSQRVTSLIGINPLALIVKIVNSLSIKS